MHPSDTERYHQSMYYPNHVEKEHIVEVLLREVAGYTLFESELAWKRFTVQHPLVSCAYHEEHGWYIPERGTAGFVHYTDCLDDIWELLLNTLGHDLSLHDLTIRYVSAGACSPPCYEVQWKDWTGFGRILPQALVSLLCACKGVEL